MNVKIYALSHLYLHTSAYVAQNINKQSTPIHGLLSLPLAHKGKETSLNQIWVEQNTFSRRLFSLKIYCFNHALPFRLVLVKRTFLEVSTTATM